MLSLERDSGISFNDDEEGESQTFENKECLSQDLRFLSGMPELCDVMFLVGEERVPVYGVKAILAIRSRVFYKMLFGPGGSKKLNGNQNVGRRFLDRFTDQQRRFSTTQAFSRVSVRPSSNGTNGSSNQIATTSTLRTVLQINEFDPDVFKQLLEYIHTGSVVIQPKNFLGLLNAADHFALEDLRRACADFSRKCISLDTVCSLLVTAEHYIQYKSSKIFVQRVLDFVDRNGDEILQLADFVHLPRHVVELILSREELRASESNKFRAVLRWSRHHMLYHSQETTLRATMAHFNKYINFRRIPAHQLMNEIRPLDVVPDDMMMNALAYQADPSSVVDQLQICESVDANSQTSPRPRCNTGSRQHQPPCQSRIRGKLSLGDRSRSVDRHLSKCSNDSSNCSDSGFQDDFYGSASNTHNSRIINDSVGSVPRPTVVRVQSPTTDEGVDRTKSCNDLSQLTLLTSVHYRF